MKCKPLLDSLVFCSCRKGSYCFTLNVGPWYHTNFPKLIHNIIFPEGQKQYIRKYHLLFRDITGNLHFHFVKCYYFGLTTYIISLSQSVRTPESYKEKEKERESLSWLPSCWHFMVINKHSEKTNSSLLKDMHALHTALNVTPTKIW